MTLDDAIYSRLTAYTALTALVKRNIYPATRGVTGSAPYVIVQKIADSRIYAMGTTVNVRRPLYQFTCWATTPNGASDVAAQVVAAIEGQRRQVWGGDGGVTIQVCYIRDEIEVFDEDAKLYGVIVEAEVCYETA